MEPSEEIEHASCVLNVLHNAATTKDTAQIINCFSDDGTFCLGSERVWHAHAIEDGGLHSMWQLLGRQPSSRTIQEVDSVGTRSIIIAKFEEQFEDEGHGSAKAFGSICYDTNSSSGSEGWKILRYQLLLPASLEESGDPQVLPPYQPRVGSMENQVSTSSSVSTAEPCGRIQIHESRPIGPESIVKKRLLLMGTADSSSSENLCSSEDPRSHEVTEVEGDEAGPGAYAVRGIRYMTAWMGSPTAHERTSSLHSQSSSRHIRSTVANNNNEKPVSAVLVNDVDLEANIRHQIISNAVQANVVESEEPSKYNGKKIRLFVLLLLIVGAAIGLSIGFAKQKGDDDSMEPTTPTLMEVMERGFLRCGIRNTTGFGHRDGNFPEGFSVDMCRAIAAVVFGNQSKVEFIVPNFQDRFLLLENRSVDILIGRDTITMERDIQEATTGMGFSFSIPYFYDGLGFAGKDDYVQCADSLITWSACDEIKICVIKGTTHYDKLSLLFSARHIVEKDTLEDLFKGLGSDENVGSDGSDGSNKCNVIAHEQASLEEKVAREMGYNGNYTLGKTLLSKEPLGMVTRDNDHQWASIVNGVIETLLFAEAQNATKDDVLAKINNNSSTIDTRFWKAVDSVGNYGDIYERHLEEILPRQGLNKLHGYDINQSSGLLYSLPFGEIQNVGQGPSSDGTIERILSQGVLRCGVVVRVGFAQYDQHYDQWSGLDVDYCRAVTLSLFAEDDVDSTLVIVPLPPIEGELLKYLANGTIDLLSGGNFELDQHMFESSSNATSPSFMGFSFSTPYYYNDLFFGGFSEFENCSGLLETGPCPNITICVGNETIHHLHLESLVDPAFIVPVGYPVTEGILNGSCTATAGSDADVLFNQELPDIISKRYGKEYFKSQFKDSQYSLSLVTMGDDSQWSAFVNWIVISTIYAEEEDINRFTANQMPLVNLFGDQFERMFRDTIAFVGNYQELYARNIERYIPRQGRNLLNDGNPSFGPQHSSRLREKYTAE